MFGTEPWGYGGYGEFRLVVWIILVIAAVAGPAFGRPYVGACLALHGSGL